MFSNILQAFQRLLPWLKRLSIVIRKTRTSIWTISKLGILTIRLMSSKSRCGYGKGRPKCCLCCLWASLGRIWSLGRKVGTGIRWSRLIIKTLIPICVGQWSKKVVDFMRQRLQPVTGGLQELEDFARAENVPVIPHETVAYFRLLLESLQTREDFRNPNGHGFWPFDGGTCSSGSRLRLLTAIQRWLSLPRLICQVWQPSAGHPAGRWRAMDLLETLEDSYDLVFMDSAKSKYVSFCPKSSSALILVAWSSLMMSFKEEMLPSLLRKLSVVNGLLPRTA